MLVIHTSYELGHGNVGEVESSYFFCDFGDRRPNGGLPKDYLTQNKVRNKGICPFVASTVGRCDLASSGCLPVPITPITIKRTAIALNFDMSHDGSL